MAALKFFREDLRRSWLRLEETPFDSVAKLMGSRYQRTGLDRHTWFYKGAPDVLLGLCASYYVNADTLLPLTEAVAARVQAKVRGSASV